MLTERGDTREWGNSDGGEWEDINDEERGHWVERGKMREKGSCLRR